MHKIISINRFGITCSYFSSRNKPAITLFAATFLLNLVFSRSNQCFGCRLDQSHCRKLHIQIWLWPGLNNNNNTSGSHLNSTIRWDKTVTQYVPQVQAQGILLYRLLAFSLFLIVLSAKRIFHYGKCFFHLLLTFL